MTDNPCGFGPDQAGVRRSAGGGGIFMLEFVTGNVINDDAEARVCTVNCVGVMGRGVALDFAKAFPKLKEEYVRRCKLNAIKPGGGFGWYLPGAITRPRVIVCVATKNHWRNPSKLLWVLGCLDFLKNYFWQHHIRTAAIPALGCGNGGLAWGDVVPHIRERFQNNTTNVRVYLPHG